MPLPSSPIPPEALQSTSSEPTGSTQSELRKSVVDSIALLQSADIHFDNPNVADDKKLTFRKLVIRLVDLSDQAESLAVTVVNMWSFLREAEKCHWYCLEDIIVRGQWTPLEHPTPGHCGKHSECLQGFTDSESNANNEPKLKVRVYKTTWNAGV